MKNLIFSLALVLMLTISGFAQQINYTHGYTTAGVPYTVTGKTSVDSTETWDVVLDMQDYYLGDFNPLFSDDSVVIGNSNRLFLGTLWTTVDAAQAADSTCFGIEAYPGFRDYEAGNTTRIETDDILWSTTAITLRDSDATASLTKGDVQWTPTNVYLHATSRILPSEFIKIKYFFDLESFDGGSSGTVNWMFVYPAVYEREQANRTTTHSRDAKKERESLR